MTRAHGPGYARLALALAVVLTCQACAPVYWLGARVLYEKAPSPPSVRLDVPYDPAAPDDPKRQLDLYLPGGRDFPLVVFVHGGGWAWGDRTQSFGGADVYRNIGRFLASQGIGTAVIGYRLVWPMDWQSQVGDVARALAWVQAHAQEQGGRPDRVFLMGHSAGAQLAARVATDPAWLAAAHGSIGGICGVVAVSGAGYDLGDIDTYRKGFDPLYFAERFGGSRLDGTWWHDASVTPFLDAGDPPFLVVSATGESAGLRRQSALIHEQLGKAGVPSTFVTVKGSSHERIILELSRADKTAGPAVLKFLRDTPCPRTAGQS
ncbi:MAG: alpha/beta hydrolase [Acidobacteria bacterium]|nr:alpha/beta hydrolase [Acidobacteriota bacterium]